MPHITKQIRSQIVDVIRAESRVDQPVPGELERKLSVLIETHEGQVMWDRLRTGVIQQMPDGTVPANVGARLFNAIFLDLMAAQGLNWVQVGACLFRLAVGDAQNEGIDWLSGMEETLELTDEAARNACPALSPHPAAVELRRRLRDQRKVGIRGADAVHNLCRAVLLGYQWGDGNGFLADYLTHAAVLPTGATNVDGLSIAHDFVDRLRQHWGANDQAQHDLAIIAREIRTRLAAAAIPQGAAAARLALRRIGILQAVEKLAPRLAGAGQPAPWTEEDQRSISDPDRGPDNGDRLVSLFRVVTSGDPEVLDVGFKQRLHWTLCLSALGLEQVKPVGHRLEHYPRATDAHDDERGPLSRLRFLVRVAVSPNGVDGLQRCLGEQLGAVGAAPHAAVASLQLLSQPRSTDEPAQMVAAAVEGGQADQAAIARRLVSLEIDTWKAHYLDEDSVSLLRTILSYVPEGQRNQVMAAEVAAEGLLRAMVHGAPNRVRFFERWLGYSEPVRIEPIVVQGQHAFRSWLGKSYHREFDAGALMSLHARLTDVSELQGAATRHHFDTAIVEVERFGCVNPVQNIQEFGFFGQYHDASAFRNLLLGGGDRLLGGALGLPKFHALALEARANGLAGQVLRSEATSLQDAQPIGNPVLAQAVRNLWQNPNDDFDGLGRSRGMMVALVADPELTAMVLNQNRLLLAEPHRTSLSGVTPLMVAAREASNGRGDALKSLSQWIRSPGPGGIDARDSRGWRAIHHALACGNTEAANLLATAGAQLGLMAGDGTTSLLAAMLAAGGGFGKSVRWVLDSPHLAQQQLQALIAFVAPAAEENRDASGGRTNVLAAAFRQPFCDAKPVLELLASRAEGVWTAPQIGGKVDPVLEDRVVDVMDCHSALIVPLYRSNKQFRGLVNSDTCAPRVCRKLVDSLNPNNIASVQKKLAAMIADGVDVLGFQDAVSGNLLHQIVARLRQLRAGQNAPHALDVVELVYEVLRAKNLQAALAQPLGQAGSDPIIRAVRSGLPLLSLLYSQALENQPDDSDLAALFVQEPSRYQSEVDPQFQLIRQGAALVWRCGAQNVVDLCVQHGVGQWTIEAPYDQQQCLRFLKDARLDIQRNLNGELIPPMHGIDGAQIVAIDAHAFEKCLAHQVRKAG